MSSLYTQSQQGKTFPLFGVTASVPTASNSPTAGNGNASPPQTDLVSQTASGLAGHVNAAMQAGQTYARGGVLSHPLFWGIVAIQVGFVGLGVLAHLDAKG